MINQFMRPVFETRQGSQEIKIKPPTPHKKVTQQEGWQSRRVANEGGTHQHPLSTECGRSTKATAFVGDATTLCCWTHKGYRLQNRRHACMSVSRCKCLESCWHHAPSLCLSKRGCQAGCCWSSTAPATAVPAFVTTPYSILCGLQFETAKHVITSTG